MEDMDLVSRLEPEEIAVKRHASTCVNPDDAKYEKDKRPLIQYLTPDAEWRMCAEIQRILLETRMEFSQAEQWHVDEVVSALDRIDPVNISLIEDNITKHDQLAVIEEIGRYVSPETKALLHPGTTSYDILDTARSYLQKKAWQDVIRPKALEVISKISDKAEMALEEKHLQAGRTHLQDTSPVLFSQALSIYAARLAGRVRKTDECIGELKGKISGIVGTGASIDAVIGEGKSLEFERAVLSKLGLEPDYTATQIVQKEELADAGNAITTMMLVLKDFANDMRLLYSSGIGEVTSRESEERLGGSSADATKNNPINYENIRGKAKAVEAGMAIIYDMIVTNLQRDLSGSVEARYEPAGMMAKAYESFSRASKALDKLSIVEDRMAENLERVRKSPGEAMTAILRGEKWTHSEYGTGHDFVKNMGVRAKREGKPLLEAALQDREFRDVYDNMSSVKQMILGGELERYTGSAAERARLNINYARETAGTKGN